MIDIKDLIKGEKYTIVTDEVFGGPMNTRVTFISLKDHEPWTHGSGSLTQVLVQRSWAFYGDSNKTPATFLICKRYCKRKCSVFNVKNIISIKKGWHNSDE